MVGVSALTSQVSYPLYAAVPAGSFVEYHRRYRARIPPVIVVPGFVSFLACATLPLVGPPGLPGWAVALIALGGLTALGATVTAAIPSHLRLERDGFQPRVYRMLRRADLIRTGACVLSAALLVGFS